MIWLRKLRSFRSLPGADRRRVLQAIPVLWGVSLGLRYAGYSRCHRWLQHRSEGAFLARRRSASSSKATEQDFELAYQYSTAVGIAAANVWCRARCLERSLALWWLLRRRGIAADMRIGVRKSDAQLEAHAWIELDGEMINDGDDVHQRFAAFEEAILPKPVETP